MTKPKWQRARILVGSRRGEFIWVDCKGRGTRDRAGNYCRSTNLKKPGATIRGRPRLWVVLADIELLAEFANKVAFETWTPAPRADRDYHVAAPML